MNMSWTHKETMNNHGCNNSSAVYCLTVSRYVAHYYDTNSIGEHWEQQEQYTLNSAEMRSILLESTRRMVHSCWVLRMFNSRKTAWNSKRWTETKRKLRNSTKTHRESQNIFRFVFNLYIYIYYTKCTMPFIDLSISQCEHIFGLL